MARMKTRAVPGERRGSPCPFMTEFMDAICGEPAEHWSAAVNAYLCGEHHAAVRHRFAGGGNGMGSAAWCPACGEERADCRCAEEGDSQAV